MATDNRSGLGLPSDPGSSLNWQFYFPDFIGSNSVVVRDDGVVQKSFFRPFGEFTQVNGGMSSYLFTDQEHDAESGLQYFGARYYDPWVGRFLSHDPHVVGSQSGVSFDRIGSDPQEFNPYSYVANRPTIMVDPTGEYGRGNGWSDRKWKKFDKKQKRAAKKMRKRARTLTRRADRKDAAGKTGGDKLRQKADNLNKGAGFLENDGSDGKTLAHAFKADKFEEKGLSKKTIADAKVGGTTMLVNVDHKAWNESGTGGEEAAAHESLHSAGLHDQRDARGIKAQKYGDKNERRTFRKMKGTPQADVNPDHIVDEIY